MTPTGELDRSPGGGPGIDLDAIEKQLRDLWSHAGEQSGEAGITRAAMFNWVVLAPLGALIEPVQQGTADEHSQQNAVAELVSRIAAVLPCRALVIEASTPSAGAPPIEAWISSHCRPEAPGRKQLCCEQITIRATPDGAASVASALVGLLLPDLPTVVYAPAAVDLEGALLARLAPHFDRLIVDSSRFPAPDAALVQLAAWASGQPRHEIADLGWARLEAWREMIATPFDAPPFDAALATLELAEIQHDPAARAQALLLAGWLASCLGYRPRRVSAEGFEFEAGDRVVHVRLTSVPGPAPASTAADLRRVELRTTDGTRFVVAVDPRHATLLESAIEASLHGPLPRRFDREPLDEATLLLRLLQRGERNQAFEAALAAVAGALIIGSRPA